MKAWGKENGGQSQGPAVFSLFSLPSPRRRLSFALPALSSNVLLSPCSDHFSSVDLSHCRPLFPVLYLPSLFFCPVDFCWRTLSECCSLTFPSDAPCCRCLNPHKGPLCWAPCQPGPPPSPHSCLSPLLQEPWRFSICN